MSKHILVTGGCGWLGAEIVRTLLSRGDTVIAADVVISPAMVALAAKQPRLTLATSDLGEWPQAIRLFKFHPIDAVIHAAAIVGVAQADDIPLKAMRVNVEGAVNLFEAMCLHGVKRVVHISTEETYGDFRAAIIDEEHPQKPLSVYGLTKLAAEHYGRVYSRNRGLECINVRTCWVYGPHLPRLRMPRTFIEAALRGESYHEPAGGRFAVDQVYIADTVAGAILALDKPDHRFDAYNIATGTAPTIADVAAAVNRAISGARITVGDTEDHKPGGIVLSVKKGALDIRRAQTELGYRPQYDLQKGIEETIAATREAMTSGMFR